MQRLFTLMFFSVLMASATGDDSFANVDPNRPTSIVYAVQPTTYESMQHGELSLSVIRLAADLDVPVKFYVCPWARCLKAIEDGEADLINDVYYTAEREQVMAFIKPAYETLEQGFRFYSLQSLAGAIRRYEDLYKFSVVTVRGNLYFERFDEDKRIRRLVTKHISQSVPLIYKNRVDILIAPPSLTDEYLAIYDPENRLVEQPYQHKAEVSLYYAVSKKSPWLAYTEEISRAIQSQSKKAN